jgi:NO-binding membrane sensor protein with MHYT domain
MITNFAHEYRLVALSVLLATSAAYAALELAGRLTAARAWPRVFWLAGSSTAMGIGIAAMHYVDMFALNIPMPVFYHLPTVMLSLLAGIIGSAAFLFAVSRPGIRLWQEIAASVAMGTGIAGTHYVGMAAMRCSAAIVYDRGIVALSIGMAITIFLIALRLASLQRGEGQWFGGKSSVLSLWAAPFH